MVEPDSLPSLQPISNSLATVVEDLVKEYEGRRIQWIFVGFKEKGVTVGRNVWHHWKAVIVVGAKLQELWTCKGFRGELGTGLNM
ncbi:hypothetical protein PPACK8108_LOCUS16318, partial [Phakopsora pachyrhizi]